MCSRRHHPSVPKRSASGADVAPVAGVVPGGDEQCGLEVATLVRCIGARSIGSSRCCLRHVSRQHRVPIFLLSPPSLLSWLRRQRPSPPRRSCPRPPHWMCQRPPLSRLRRQRRQRRPFRHRQPSRHRQWCRPRFRQRLCRQQRHLSPRHYLSRRRSPLQSRSPRQYPSRHLSPRQFLSQHLSPRQFLSQQRLLRQHQNQPARAARPHLMSLPTLAM